MSEIPTYQLFIQFALKKDVLQVLRDGASALLKKLRDLLLSQPQRIILEKDLDIHLAALRLENHKV